jgi:hypothetical protein
MSSNPTTGLGVAAAVVLTGTGVHLISPTVAGTRGKSQYKVSIPMGGSVQVIATPVDDAGVAVPSGGTSPASTGLLTEGNYAVLAYSAVTGSADGSVVTGGNVGISPTALSGITEFPPSTVTAPGVLEGPDTATGQAQTDLTADIVTYTAMTATQSGLADLSTNDGGGGAGVYHAGVYKGGALDIPTSITLDAQGNSAAIFVFVASSTVVLESGASVLLANGAQAANVYWIVGSSFTSVWNGIQSDMVGNILAHTSISLGGGTLYGRALANTGAVTMATAEYITVPTATPIGHAAVVNAITQGSCPDSVLPSWYKPSPAPSYASPYMASAVVDDDDANPWTVRGRKPGQTAIDFQIPTFENTEGQSLVDTNQVMDETFIDTIFATLLVTVTGGTSIG